MSMSQANAALVIDTYADTARLGITLTQAERMVDQASQRMGQKVDSSFGQVGNKIVRMMSAAVGAGLAIKVLDDAFRKLADGIRESQGAKQIGESIANGIVEAIRGVPIAGALMDISSQVTDSLFGGPLEMERARARAQQMMREQQRQREAAPEFMRELEMQGASGVILERMQRQRELERVRALAERASLGSTQMVNGAEEELVPGFIEARQVAIDQAMRKFDEEVAKRRAQDAERIASERRRAEEQAAQEEQRRIDAQEKAYEKFIEGNTNDAILALEAQLQQAGTAAAPSRGQRLADLMAGMGGGIATGESALGAFTFATGDATQISRGILDTATQQLATLERIETIQAQIRDLQKGVGFN